VTCREDEIGGVVQPGVECGLTLLAAVVLSRTEHSVPPRCTSDSWPPTAGQRCQFALQPSGEMSVAGSDGTTAIAVSSRRMTAAPRRSRAAAVGASRNR